MATMEHLLSEAERIRGEYRQTQDAEVRKTLAIRYKEIDRQLTALRQNPEAKQPRGKSKGRPKGESKGKPKVLSKGIATLDVLAAELLNLCQSVTADGIIADEEIEQLRLWLNASKNSDIPAVRFLRDIVELVCKDGVITGEERKQLYTAIETILPVDLRKFARQRRKIVEALEKEVDRKRRTVAKEVQRREREASAPLHTADFMVAGVSHEGRDEIVLRHVHDGMNIFLVREPNNKYSQFATGIVLENGLQIGYVPEEEADELAPLLDNGHPYKAHVKKTLTGGRIPIPVVVTAVYSFDAPISGLVTQQNNPIVQRPMKKRGWFG